MRVWLDHDGGKSPVVSPWYRFCRSLVYTLGRILAGLTVEGRENVPADGPIVVTSNHVSLLDPPILGCCFPREIAFAAKKELFGVPILGPLIRSLNAIPVDRARISVATFREFGRALDGGKGLLYFPEGTRSRTGRFGEPRVGIGMVLAKYPVTIVPVYVEGTDSLLRCLIRRERMRVVIGPAYALPGEITGPSEDRRTQYRRIAGAVMDRVRRLKEADPSTDDRETDLPARDAVRPASGGSAGSGRRDPNTREGMETTE
jgi:1-acyl-sn-glycerol-3-phosphate acyltransferase